MLVALHPHPFVLMSSKLSEAATFITLLTGHITRWPLWRAV